ncbi:hypothetical protein [Chromobacterium vaccinii]|uniref:hypothetical protein n=1 Tax=Chromobacterium vaccinii TaxID=1108595 RepID=UPI0011856493|nr:hypothetical protein [Chromobacterium vaccinii]
MHEKTLAISNYATLYYADQFFSYAVPDWIALAFELDQMKRSFHTIKLPGLAAGLPFSGPAAASLFLYSSIFF